MESAVRLDLGKSVFQVHGDSAGGAVVIQRRLTRGRLLAFFAKQPACLVGMEACAAAHHWGRELHKLGHMVRLMPPRYVVARTDGTFRYYHRAPCDHQGIQALLFEFPAYIIAATAEAAARAKFKL